jgi:hypothetical protein
MLSRDQLEGSAFPRIELRKTGQSYARGKSRIWSNRVFNNKCIEVVVGEAAADLLTSQRILDIYPDIHPVMGTR